VAEGASRRRHRTTGVKRGSSAATLGPGVHA